MEQLTNIKKRMATVRDIGQMTHAMQLISSAKMRKARSQLARTMPFFALVAESMVELRESGAFVENPFFEVRQKKQGETWKIGYFILTGEQGLAGAYNLNVVQTTENHIHAKTIDNIEKGLKTDVSLYVAGSIGKDRLIKDGFHVVEEFKYPISEPTYYRARDISAYIFDLYVTHQLDLVYFIYTRMESAINMKPMVTRVLPVNASALDALIPEQYRFEEEGFTEGGEIEFLPSSEEVVNYLINTYLNGMVYGVLAEAFASEQTARMTAMENATENAEEMLADLTLKRNLARQARITSEISEIVGGAEVLAAQPGPGEALRSPEGPASGPDIF